VLNQILTSFGGNASRPAIGGRELVGRFVQSGISKGPYSIDKFQPYIKVGPWSARTLLNRQEASPPMKKAVL
jgi:hypothetical protein